MVDLPAPVAPTNATDEPPGICMAAPALAPSLLLAEASGADQMWQSFRWCGKAECAVSRSSRGDNTAQ